MDTKIVNARSAVVNCQLPGAVVLHATDRELGILAAVSATGHRWGGGPPVDWAAVGDWLGLRPDSVRAARAAVARWIDPERGCLLAAEVGGVRALWGQEDDRVQWAQVPADVVKRVRSARSGGVLRFAFALGLCAGRDGSGWACLPRLASRVGLQAAAAYRSIRVLLESRWLALTADGWRVSTTREKVRKTDPSPIRDDRSAAGALLREPDQDQSKRAASAQDIQDVDRASAALAETFGAQALDQEAADELARHVEAGTVGQVADKAEAYAAAVTRGAAVAMGSPASFLRSTWRKWRLIAVDLLAQVAGAARRCEFAAERYAFEAQWIGDRIEARDRVLGAAGLNAELTQRGALAVLYGLARSSSWQPLEEQAAEARATVERVEYLATTACAVRAVEDVYRWILGGGAEADKPAAVAASHWLAETYNRPHADICDIFCRCETKAAALAELGL